MATTTTTTTTPQKSAAAAADDDTTTTTTAAEQEQQQQQQQQSNANNNENDDNDDYILNLSAQALWDSVASIIDVTEKHPFLVAMVDGSLPYENFQYYVVQDALYLKDFALSLRMLADVKKASSCITCDDGGDDPQQEAAAAAAAERVQRYAKEVKDSELELHNGFFKQWNIDITSTSEDQQMPNCLLYTSYMIRVVTTRPFGEGLAVLTPCFWVYMHVGKCMLQLRKQLGDTVQRPPQYDAWIDMYGGEEFEELVNDCIDLLDSTCKKLVAQATTTATSDDGEHDDASTATRETARTTLREMKKHFILSCKMEHMFWDQAQMMQSWPTVLSNRTSTHDFDRYDSLS